MKYFNLYYVVAILTGISILLINQYMSKEAVFFYGFAENKETEINFNYPVVVDEILVSPGQEVVAGTPLLKLKRVRPKERLEDQGFRIDELSAKARQWKKEKEGELALLEKKKESKIFEIDSELQKIREEKRFKESLYKDLQSLDSAQRNYTPLTDRIKVLEEQKTLALEALEQEITNLKSELTLGMNPYRVEISRLAAERSFEQANKIIEVELKAPAKGVIGNIYCKRAEHIPSFKTLMIFYEPNPTQVKAYVHEDQILEVALKDSILIRSTKNESISCKGAVHGLGSRIVEIPERLRKIPDLKTYGREILVSIPSNNNFLQKEKVGLEIIP
ncbi:MAG: hypothetical protein AAF696_14570 [Bacteroidota bacterium]